MSPTQHQQRKSKGDDSSRSSRSSSRSESVDQESDDDSADRTKEKHQRPQQDDVVDGDVANLSDEEERRRLFMSGGMYSDGSMNDLLVLGASYGPAVAMPSRTGGANLNSGTGYGAVYTPVTSAIKPSTYSPPQIRLGELVFF